MIKMIITDLDNTLLRSGTYISDYTISVLKECQQKGIKVAFATARSTQASKDFLAQFKPDIFIGYGGGLAFCGDNIIYRSEISADVSYNLINDCLKEPLIPMVLAVNESIAHTNIKEYCEEFDHYQYDDFTVNRNISYLKISVVAANPDIVDNIAVRYPMCDLLRYTGEDLYRFANQDAVKWKAVKAVIDYFNILSEELVAFGDDRNDLEMIKNCPNGIAVGNAIDEVKAVAKNICETNDNDGVAKWISEKILARY
ncbi:MAG: HAD family hydrolase [Lachnospiraceae bacterium]|nr:HAD family hydrolase [Lachnospiraceae bacterium]